LVFEDDKCDGKDGSSAIQKLINVDQVQVVVGSICSVATIPAGKIAQENKILMVSPTSSAPEVAQVGDYVYRFRNDADVTKKLAEQLTKQGIKTVFALVENTDYGVGYANSLAKSFSGTVIQEKFQSDEKDFDILAKKIVNSTEPIDAILFIGNSNGNIISMINALDKEGLLKKFAGNVFGTETSSTDVIKQAVGNLLEGVKIVQLANLEDLDASAIKLSDEFASKFEIKSSPLFAVLEAESLDLVLDGIKANGYNATKVKQYLDSFTANNPRDGFFGKYYFSPERSAVGLNFLAYQIKNGKAVVEK